MNLFWVVWNVNIFVANFGCVQTSATLDMPRKKRLNEQMDKSVAGRDEKPEQMSAVDEKIFNETKLEQADQTSTGKHKDGDKSEEAGSDRGGKKAKAYSVVSGFVGGQSAAIANLVEFALNEIPAYKENLKEIGYTDAKIVEDNEGKKTLVAHRIGPLPIPEMGEASQKEREVAKSMHDKYVERSSREGTTEK